MLGARAAPDPVAREAASDCTRTPPGVPERMRAAHGRLTRTSPARASRSSHTSRVAATSPPARPPDWRNNAARWRRTRSISSAARPLRGRAARSASSSRSRRRMGEPLDDDEILGREDRAGSGRCQLLAAGDRLAVHPRAAPAGGEDLGLDESRAVRVVDLGPGDRALGAGPDHRLGRSAPGGATGPQIGDRLEHARLTGPVGPGDDGGPFGCGRDVGGAEDAEVGQLEVPDAHRDRGPFRRPAPA